MYFWAAKDGVANHRLFYRMYHDEHLAVEAVQLSTSEVHEPIS